MRTPMKAALLTTGQLRCQEYRVRAAECDHIANRWPGLIKQQYEELARQWRVLAEQLNTQ